ncbi:BQ5605_C014g07542 [Microbotryum silenes-dioicae]|uniref:BQ5605_C014g07542 protein n=1 Tax=Microbotryum silenes-dioicae TaxID=796604 RepID=A0A2X0LYF9_9BASI|nr:BQ5605_C014g07542 [Microbotryum silenes-dioicae]
MDAVAPVVIEFGDRDRDLKLRQKGDKNITVTKACSGSETSEVVVTLAIEDKTEAEPPSVLPTKLDLPVCFCFCTAPSPPVPPRHFPFPELLRSLQDFRKLRSLRGMSSLSSLGSARLNDVPDVEVFSLRSGSRSPTSMGTGAAAPIMGSTASLMTVCTRFRPAASEGGFETFVASLPVPSS